VGIGTLTREQRALSPQHHIDGAFINDRLCFSVFGRQFVDVFEERRRRNGQDDHWARLANDHLLVQMALSWCAQQGIPSLGQILADPRPNVLFASTERLEACDEVYTACRVKQRIMVPYEGHQEVFLEYHTQHIRGDTARLELSRGLQLSMIAIVGGVDDNGIVARPLIIGNPVFDPDREERGVDFQWLGWEAYQVLPGDIDEFQRLEDVAVAADEWQNVMRSMPERQVKEAICDLLGDVPSSDWGGEQADHFSASVHLSGQPRAAAFLMKGPSGGRYFREMTCDMLGKRADQICRMSRTPARLLVVQHCHQIGPAVRETLRHFAVTPVDPRHYCLVDGKDTYRILKAYERI